MCGIYKWDVYPSFKIGRLCFTLQATLNYQQAWL